MSIPDSPVKRLQRLRSFSISTSSWSPIPPVPRLLRSNEPPNSVEHAIVKRAINDARGKLEALSPISRGGAGRAVFKVERSPSKAFEQKRVALVQFISSHQAILSPFRTLPSELLVLIFEEYMRDWEDADVARTRCPPPWIFTGVCRFWRAVALDAPTLWRTLPSFRIDLGGESADAKFRRLVMQVERAKGVPLTIKIVSQHGSPTPTPKTLNRLHWYASFAERWKDVSLRIEHDDLKFLSTIRGRLSSLQRLHLAVASPQVPHGLAQAFAEAPFLEEINIEGYFPPKWITFPSRLRRFSGHLCSPELLLRIFHDTPHLEKCVLHVKDSTDKTTGNVPSLTLNKLRQFHISVDKDSNPLTLNSFFDKITLPALESLHISISHLNRRSDYSLYTFTKFLSRSSPTGMRELTLRCHSQPKGIFLDILKTTPNLVSLSIKGAHISDLESLISRPNSGKSNILPQLKKLCIDADYDIPPFTLGNIAHSRTSSSSTILNRQPNSASSRCTRLEFLCVGLLYDNYVETLMSNWESWSLETREEAMGLQRLAVDICHAHEAMVQYNKTLPSQKLETRFGQLEECKVTDASILEFAFIPDVLECIAKGPSDYKRRAKKLLDRWRSPLESRRLNYQWNRYWSFNRDYPILAVYHSGRRRTIPSKSLPYNISRDEPFSAYFFPHEVTSNYWSSF